MIGKYELNKIYCLDCYEAIKDIPDKSIDCIYTDIPYLYHQGGSGNSELGQRTAKKRLELMGLEADYLANKGKSRGEALRIVKRNDIERTSIEDGINYDILKEFCRVMKKINIFIWCSKLQILDLMNFFAGGGCGLKCLFEILTWNKTNPTPTTNNSWLPDIEYCLYFREPGVPLNNGYELKSKWYTSSANKKDKDKFSHATIKPLQLVTRHLQHATNEGDIVLDCFIGSGTTAVACKNLGRNFIGFEIAPKWYKIAVDRLNNIQANGQTSIFTE